MKEEQKKALGYVFAGIVLVGLALVIVGMCIGVVSVRSLLESKSIGLFDDDWGVETPIGTAPGNTFAIIAFILAIIGAVVLVADSILRIFVKKDIKVLRIAGAAFTFIGTVLVLIAGLLLASGMEEFTAKGIGATVEQMKSAGVSVSAGAGVWLGFIGGLVATVGGALPLLKALNR